MRVGAPDDGLNFREASLGLHLQAEAVAAGLDSILNATIIEEGNDVYRFLGEPEELSGIVEVTSVDATLGLHVGPNIGHLGVVVVPEGEPTGTLRA